MHTVASAEPKRAQTSAPPAAARSRTAPIGNQAMLRWLGRASARKDAGPTETVDAGVEAPAPSPAAEAVPPPPAAPPAPAAPVLTHETRFNAPDGSPKTRTDVGVAEVVAFQSTMPGTWKASKGWPKTGKLDAKFVWTAPSRAAAPDIEVTAGGQTASVAMNVIEPGEEIVGEKKRNLAYPPGTQGAGMKLVFNYTPKNVSFGNVFAKEIPGPASNIAGYFAAYPAATLWHYPSVRFTRIKQNNKDSVEDTAWFDGWPAPWTEGGFEWKIPNHFRVVGETGNGKKFATVTQRFRLRGAPHAGRSSVSKAGARVQRDP